MLLRVPAPADRQLRGTTFTLAHVLESMARFAVWIALTAVLAVQPGCGATVPANAPRTATSTSATWTYRADGLSADVPRGWHVVSRPLTDVSSPVQRLVVTSFGVSRHRPDGGCSPASALREMPRDGALLFMFEYQGPTHHDAQREPPRPRQFRLDPKTLQPYECMGRSYMMRFRDHGRVFQAHVYLGRRASSRTRDRVLGVLDSLRIRPASPEAAAVWVPPGRLLARDPYLGVACGRPNRFACDRVGLAVWLRTPAVGVTATVDGRRMVLDDRQWSGPVRGGRRRMLAGFLHPAGLLSGPLKIRADDAAGRWTGRHPVEAGVGLLIERSPSHYVRTSLRVSLAPGWG
jgi:hypothetical protein